MHDARAVLFDQRDRRQEARALQAVLVELVRRGVGAGHQHHAFGEQALEQAAQQHRVADVADEELVEAPARAAAAPSRGDRRQRIALAGVRAQALVHFAHEAMEMRCGVSRRIGRLVEEQVDQEGLAAADAAPQVQARAWPARFGAKQGQAVEQAAARSGRRAARRACGRVRQRACCGAVDCQSPRGDAGGVACAGRQERGFRHGSIVQAAGQACMARVHAWRSRRQPGTHAVLDRAAQVHQLAMEEVAGVGHAHQLRRLLAACVDPGEHRLRVDDLVGLALDHQPRAGRAARSAKSQLRPTGGAIESSSAACSSARRRSDT